MRLISNPILITVLAIPLCAMAAADPCNGIPETQAFATSLCECGKSLSRHPIKAPKDMSLIAACRYKKVEFVGTVGDFYFKGKATVNGEVRRFSSTTQSDSVVFKAKTSGKHTDFIGALNSMKFGNDPAALQRLKLLPLSEGSPCWSADATIKVSRLHVQAGYESAEDGSYPTEFEVMKIGKYKPCTVEDIENEEDEE